METRILTRTDALTAGYTDDEMHRAVRDGQLRRIGRGLYVEGDIGETDEHLVRGVIALEKLPRGTALSHVTAAVLYGLPTPALDLATVHVTRAGATGRRTSRTLVHSAALDIALTRRIASLPVTSPARTVVDLARQTSEENAVIIGDAAQRTLGTSRSELDSALEEGRHRRGIGNARRAVHLMDARSESPGESRSRLLFGPRRVPRPVLQPNVYSADGQWLARPDFLWEKAGVIGEFDGLVKYTSDAREVVVAEKVREDRLRAAGWMVVRWTWDELADPSFLLQRLNRALQSGRPAPSPFSVDPLPTAKPPTLSDLLLAFMQRKDRIQRAAS